MAQEPVFQHSCLQPFIDHPSDNAIRDSLVKKRTQVGVRDRPKIVFDVEIYHPTQSVAHEASMQLLQGLMRRAIRPEAVRARDGCISYRMKKSARRSSRCRIMTPVECIARLCALVPPPRYPLTRFHGVLAPRAKLRPRVVPKLPATARRPCLASPATRKGPKDHRARAAPRADRAALRHRRSAVRRGLRGLHHDRADHAAGRCDPACALRRKYGQLRLHMQTIMAAFVFPV